MSPLREPGVQAALARPTGGWVRTIRDALGMTAADLAHRLGVSGVAVTKLEASEREGRARLDTLARAADALGCDLVVALVPRTSLDETVRARARRVATARLNEVTTTMALEVQEASNDATAAALDDLTQRVVVEPGLWRARDDGPLRP